MRPEYEFDEMEKLPTEEVVNILYNALGALYRRDVCTPDRAQELSDMIPSVDTMEEYLKHQSILWITLCPNFDQTQDELTELLLSFAKYAHNQLKLDR